HPAPRHSPAPRGGADTPVASRPIAADGSATEAWQTPDPWEAGRLFRKRADQVVLLARANRYEGEEDDDDEEDTEGDKVWWGGGGVECAGRRRDERVALAAARRRAQALRAPAPK